jgi:asparagine synthetase B (glutamine-hydrolysing)
MPGATDLKYAKMVADHLGTTHHIIELSEDDLINSIPETIK